MRRSLFKECIISFWKPLAFLTAIIFFALIQPAYSLGAIAFGLTDRSAIPAEVNNFYDRVLLSRALPLNIHGLFGQKRRIPSKAGAAIIKFRRYGILSSATTVLTEGTTPGGSNLSVTDLTATVYQYGDFTTITDVVDDQSPDAVLTETVGLQGDQMGLTNDELTRNIIAAGTVVRYTASRASRVYVAAGDIILVADIKVAVRTLKVAKARKITSISSASPGSGTVPINACYIGICHPRVGYDLKGMTGWKPVETYAANTTLMPGEIGSYDEVRFVESTNAKVFTGEGASSIDVYATIILGAEAYGLIDLGNSPSSQTIFHGLGSAGSSDPLNQRQTMGWKEYFTAKILNDAFMIRIETAVTA
jgi:N4-gp56 family major capsid protein